MIESASAVHPATDDSVAAFRDRLLADLADHRARQVDNPLINPVAQMAFDISRRLEAGEVTVEALRAVAKALSDTALLRRAERLRGYVGFSVDDASEGERTGYGAGAGPVTRPVVDPNDPDALRAFVRATATGRDAMADGEGEGALRPFADFARLWSRPALGFVFTAHPTFGLSQDLTRVVVDVASGRTDPTDAKDALAALSHAPEPGIDLASEHAAAQAALVHAQNALDTLVGAVLEEARALYGADWRRLDVVPATLASWVGYDLDGRTDIRWSDSFRFRLDERAARLCDLCRRAEALPEGGGVVRVRHVLAQARQAAEAAVRAFDADLGEIDAFVAAANSLTEGPHAVSVATVLEAIDAALAGADDALAEALLRLKAQLRISGLGTAHIHLRVNATQLHNGIRKIVDIEPSARFAGRLLANKLDALIAGAAPERVNFATLDLEPTTAIRQFVLMAQILKHVDAETPIRFLIAECDSPLTVLSAVYFAKRFGVLEQIDISPLFETPAALEKGATVMEQLLESDAYCDYVKRRGRLCIQTGFSDAGRFVGALPATLAIERLHLKLCDMVERMGLTGVEVVIFDTHGESMGRGAHPASLHDRFDYLLSPVVRDRFHEAGIPLKHEVSFQGGDGYMLFGAPPLAEATVAGAFRNWLMPRLHGDDCLYDQTDFALDFFLRVKAYQEDLFHTDDYGVSLGALGPDILFKTGSRRSRRQHDAGKSDGRSVLASLRAIPHNAILQQMGYLANVVAGLDFGVGDERERFVDLVRRSDRLDRLMRMVAAAKRRSSLNAVAAYAGLYDAGYWTSRAYGGAEPRLTGVFRRLATVLRHDRRHEQMMRLVHQLRHDAIRLHEILDDLDMDGGKVPRGARLEADLLHAIRVAFLQRMFILAARVPRFSPRNDISPDDILRAILTLEVPEALAVLRDTFPRVPLSVSALHLSEAATYDPGAASDYRELHDTLIEPLEALYEDIRQIGVGLAHHWGAHG